MKLDWTFAVTAASIVGTVANIYKRPWCFAVWLVTNSIWCVYDWRIGARGQSVLMFVYVLLAIWGLIRWRKP